LVKGLPARPHLLARHHPSSGQPDHERRHSGRYGAPADGQHARRDSGDGRYAATAVMVETRREECTVGKIQVNDPIRPRELTMIQGEQITVPVPEFRTHLQFC
jgi:hypothetical protein